MFQLSVFLRGMFRRIGILMKKDLLLEFREGYSVNGIILYAVTTVYIVYNGLKRINPEIWTVMFWIIFLFAASNAIFRSFSREQEGSHWYYYSITDPVSLFLSKLAYNSFWLWIVGGVILLAKILFFGNPVFQIGIFLGAVCLGGLGITAAFTLVSSMVRYARQAQGLMVILSFPLVIPVFLLLNKIGLQATGVLEDSDIVTDFLLLSAIDVLFVGLGLILFPSLWRN